MRGYTNKKGDFIEVSDKHLEVSILIKKQLQDSSPSRRCNWKLHKKCMEKEGFFDSDTSESYRCLIKDEQKKQGKLPELKKHVEMISNKKLESIKELVGEVAYEKRENQHVLKELNKAKREIIDYTLIAEQIRESFDNQNWNELWLNYNPYPIIGEFKEINNEMIVALSDLHIGALVNNEYNVYNYDVAKKRMREYLNKIIEEIKKENISKVHVIGLGDMIEQNYMHNLAYNCEFTLSEQITKATDLILKFLLGLSEYVHVEYAGIAGNHDRLNENKNKSLYSDHAVKVINSSIELFLSNSKDIRIKYIQAKDYDYSINCNGINIKFIHGDLDSLNNNLLAKHSDLDGIEYHLIVMGHYHHYEVKELGLEKYMIMFGSLKGIDDFGLSNRKIISPSQGYIIISHNGDININRVKL